MSDNETTESVEEETVEQQEDEAAAAALFDSIMQQQKEPRLVGLFGDIDEEKSSLACASLLSFYAMSGEEPIEMFISTNGGSADDMFAIVDTVKYLDSKGCEVHMAGIGKVMSAGVLILASGTKGKRRIGSNTRLMLHPIQGGTAGPFPHMSDDMRTMKKAQEHYIGVLSRETKLSIKEIRRIVNRRKDTYFTAHEAIEMGIADELL